jgi:hypothetical protein
LASHLHITKAGISHSPAVVSAIVPTALALRLDVGARS